MVVVVGIVAILVATVLSVATRINNQAKEQLTRSTIAIVTSALEQFGDYEYQYSHIDYSAFDFPLDCNDFVLSNPLIGQVGLQGTLANALGASSVVVMSVGGTFTHLPKYSGSEVLYFFLNRVPQSRQILEKIDSSLITNKDEQGNEMMISIDIGSGSRNYPLNRFIDPWGETLRYDYYMDLVKYQVIIGGNSTQYLNYIRDNKRAFPVVTSAGPDGIFGTGDDISNRD